MTSAQSIDGPRQEDTGAQACKPIILRQSRQGSRHGGSGSWGRARGTNTLLARFRFMRRDSATGVCKSRSPNHAGCVCAGSQAGPGLQCPALHMQLQGSIPETCGFCRMPQQQAPPFTHQTARMTSSSFRLAASRPPRTRCLLWRRATRCAALLQSMHAPPPCAVTLRRYLARLAAITAHARERPAAPGCIR